MFVNNNIQVESLCITRAYLQLNCLVSQCYLNVYPYVLINLKCLVDYFIYHYLKHLHRRATD